MSDKEILALFEQGGNPNYAFNLLVRKYQEKLYWHIRRIVIDHDDANDVIQNTWIKVWQNIAGFRSDSKIYTWLYRIATNEAISLLNKKRTKFFVPLVNVERTLSETIKSDDYFSATDIQKKFQLALLKLPEKQRIVFNLKYFEGMQYDAMSEVLGTSVGALKASYHHAVKKIEKIMLLD
ncbi:MAG: sigma-70 family RNA polymerase sigma factor [Bacteroidetes bacterium]|nr:sigma-70 family RNA polymerase sigma factor [Bacteroidota bacterium]MBU1720711.1 sigma-70 family RNA polymerase sigma factor [Bacteroidota bacterium]